MFEALMTYDCYRKKHYPFLKACFFFFLMLLGNLVYISGMIAGATELLFRRSRRRVCREASL
ncbi:MAG: hypothetical protein WC532_07530 [Candidatus Omnitrophota bacterium]